mgnify:CR=1 FL=1
MTDIGSKCLEGDMEIRSTLLVVVGTRLGVEVYARIARAFIDCGVDLFSNPHVGVRRPMGLTDANRARASEHGDVHTAIQWYLKWRPQQALPEDDAGVFNPLCFGKMHTYLNRSKRVLVFDPDATGWESRLSVAIAFAFQKNIVCQHGNRCFTCHKEEDLPRIKFQTPLAFLNAEVKISEWSVCFYFEQRDSFSWLVYTNTSGSSIRKSQPLQKSG